jgi:YVTN family beta-propeller protein
MTVFINYRRDDTELVADRLYDWLVRALGKDHVFKDYDSLVPGSKYLEVIDQRIGTSDAVLALIGSGWFAAADEDGRRRLDDPDDVLARELRTAFERGVMVIPVLWERATLPPKAGLPKKLRALAGLQAAPLEKRTFAGDVDHIVATVAAATGTVPSGRSEASVAAPDAPGTAASAGSAPAPARARARPGTTGRGTRPPADAAPAPRRAGSSPSDPPARRPPADVDPSPAPGRELGRPVVAPGTSTPAGAAPSTGVPAAVPFRPSSRARTLLGRIPDDLVWPALGVLALVVSLVWLFLVLVPTGPFHDPFQSGASAAVINPDGTRVHVVGAARRNPMEVTGPNVTTLDLATAGIVGTPVQLDDGYFGDVALSPDGRRLYALYRPVQEPFGPGGTRLIVVDPVTGSRIGDSIHLGAVTDDEFPALALDAAGRYLYVSNADAGNVAVVDTGTGAVESPIAVGSRPGEMASSPDGRYLYVVTAGALSVIDTSTRATVGDPIPVEGTPRQPAVAPDGRVYLTDHDRGTVSVLDPVADEPADVVEIPVGDGPRGIAIAPDGTTAYVVNELSGTVSVIDTATGSAQGPPIPVGGVPGLVAVAPDGTPYVTVTTASGGQLAVIDTRTREVTRLGPISAAPTAMSVALAGRVVVTGLDHAVVVVDPVTGSVLER